MGGAELEGVSVASAPLRSFLRPKKVSALQRGDVRTCFRFASPNNKRATGPWQRFEIMPPIVYFVTSRNVLIRARPPTTLLEIVMVVALQPNGGQQAADYHSIMIFYPLCS